ncbi:MAG: hypothetical protein HY719_05555 [Planctomycetes bacterium]|nr:hypothetical protein [Planctomycetota bacterium]
MIRAAAPGLPFPGPGATMCYRRLIALPLLALALVVAMAVASCSLFRPPAVGKAGDGKDGATWGPGAQKAAAGDPKVKRYALSSTLIEGEAYHTALTVHTVMEEKKRLAGGDFQREKTVNDMEKSWTTRLEKVFAGEARRYVQETLIARSRQQKGENPAQEILLPLHRTRARVTVDPKGEKEYETLYGVISAMNYSQLDMKDFITEQVLPPRPVAVGETWSLRVMDVLTAMGIKEIQGHVEATARLLAVNGAEGDEIAEVAFDFTAKGKAGLEEIEFERHGTARYAARLERVDRAAFTDRFVRVQPDGQSASVAAESDMRRFWDDAHLNDVAAEWEKVLSPGGAPEADDAGPFVGLLDAQRPGFPSLTTDTGRIYRLCCFPPGASPPESFQINSSRRDLAQWHGRRVEAVGQREGNVLHDARVREAPR